MGVIDAQKKFFFPVLSYALIYSRSFVALTFTSFFVCKEEFCLSLSSVR